MPGRKDYVSVREGEGRVHVQKRLVLCNLQELYIIAQAICNPPQPKCCLDKCTVCHGTEMLRKSMIIHFEKKAIDDVIYHSLSVDRATLKTASLPFEDFIEAFTEKVEVLIPHSFIATQQAQFFSE